MAEASVTFSLGSEEATVVLPVDLPGGSIPLVGDVSGTFGDAHIVGDVNLTGDLVIEGRLTGIDTFTLEGNGFQLLVQHGGVLDLAGKEKTGWTGWGGRKFASDPAVPVVGWKVGDALRVAQTAEGSFGVGVTTWGGSWATTTRPPNTGDVLLPDGRTITPEVANVTSSITLRNLRRIHFHDNPGVQSLKWLTVDNSGVEDVLSNYPIHFHLCGESVRGSVLEGVVVHQGKNHAFVVHGSHGVTLIDCVAYNTTNDAFWWDLPLIHDQNHTANNSNDITMDHCLAMFVHVSALGNPHRMTGFMLGAGHGNSVTNSAACLVREGADASGYHWPENANRNAGGNVWEPFQHNVSHNNRKDGVFVWQNDPRDHHIQDFISYRNGEAQIEHGAYLNQYQYERVVLSGASVFGFRLHALGNILLEDFITDGPLRIVRHNLAVDFDEQVPVVRRCQFTQVIYQEAGEEPSKIRYEDCDLTPSDFVLAGIMPTSIIEVYESGTLTHRWAGEWS